MFLIIIGICEQRKSWMSHSGKWDNNLARNFDFELIEQDSGKMMMIKTRLLPKAVL